VKEYRICDKCEIHHYENCGTCFGFGVYYVEGRCIPVSASVAHDKEPNLGLEISECPECGSTNWGIPNLDREVIDG